MKRSSSLRKTRPTLLKLLIIGLALAVGAFAARSIRRELIITRILKAGLAAFRAKDWPKAVGLLKEYLSENGDDVAVLEQYVRANLMVRPLQRRNVTAAIWAGRQLVRLRPSCREHYELLAKLYGGTGKSGELAHVARKALEHNHDDPEASLWLASALLASRNDRRDRQAETLLRDLITRLEQQSQKSTEYVKACRFLSRLTLRSGQNSLAERAQAAKAWLDRAVHYDPANAEALIARAAFLRSNFAVMKLSYQEMLVTVAEDLEKADTCRQISPLVWLALSEQWAGIGRFDRAASVIESEAEPAEADIRKHFVDVDDWLILVWRHKGNMAIRSADANECAELADEILAAAEHQRLRMALLPTAIKLYATAKQPGQARLFLDEYLSIRSRLWKHKPGEEKAALLSALVARAEDNYHAVAEILDPVVAKAVTEAPLRRLLAEACSKTDQPRKASRALMEYIELCPTDQQMALQLAREFLKQGDFAKAHEAARRAELLNTDNFDARLVRIANAIEIAGKPSLNSNGATLDLLDKELVHMHHDQCHRLDVAILRSRIAANRGHTDKAQKHLLAAIDDCDDALPAEIELARLYLRLNRLPDAEEICRRACLKYPTSAMPWLAISELQCLTGRKQLARATLAEAVSAVVDCDNRHKIVLKLALLEAMDGEHHEADKRIRQLIAADGHNLAARSMLLRLPGLVTSDTSRQRIVDEIRTVEGQNGRLWHLHQAWLWLAGERRKGRQRDLGKFLNGFISSDPDWSAPVLLMASYSRNNASTADVERLCDRALSTNPADTYAADWLLRLLIERRRGDEAHRLMAKLQLPEPFESKWRVRIAMEAGDFDEAIGQLRRNVAASIHDVESAALLAKLVYCQTRNASQALHCLKEAQQTNPWSLTLAATRAALLHADGQAPEAKKDLDKFVEYSQTFAAYRLRAVYLQETEQLALAEKDYLKIVDFTGRTSQGCLMLLNFCVSSHKIQMANSFVSDYLSSQPRNVAEIVSIADFLAGQNEPSFHSPAIALYQRAIELAPELHEARFALARVAYIAGRLNLAVEALRSILRSNPRSIRAMNDLAWIIANGPGNYHEALRLANAAGLIEPNNRHVTDTRATILAKIPYCLSEARDEYHKLALLTADDPALHAQALSRLGKTCTTLGQSLQAERLFRRAAELRAAIGRVREEQHHDSWVAGVPLSEP